MKRFSKHLSYANVISTIALFLVLAGGAAFAASHLGKNSVGSKQLKKNAVTTAKIKKQAVTGAKVKKDTLTGTQIDESKLGTVPSAQIANTVPANTLHVVGAPGEPPFLEGTHNLGKVEALGLTSASFVKDHDNVVQLEGVVEIPKGSTLPVAYQLPVGFRPPAGELVFQELGGEVVLIIAGSNVVIEGKDISGDVLATAEKPVVLTGVSFVAGG
jgi:hypothetical protein